jgi:hypothetical protein
MENVPMGIFVPALIVNVTVTGFVEVGLMVAGVNSHDAPTGRPRQERLTTP